MGDRLSFHYKRSQWSMQLLLAVVLGIVFALTNLPTVQHTWEQFTTNTSPWVLLIVGPWIIHQVLFWTISLAYLYVDTYDRPHWIARYRIQQGPPKRPTMPQTLKVLAWNQLVWSPFMLTIMTGLLLLRGWTPETMLPSLAEICIELLLLGISAVLIFYFSHRFLHRPWWMKKVHRVHHEYRTTTALASEYAHPVEFCLSNFGTLAGGVVLLAPSVFSIYLFTILSILTILVHHGGYALPWAPWATPHDWHHYRYKELFGTVGVMDRLFGTDQEFKDLKQDDVR